MKKIIMSLSMIAAVAVLVVGATGAFFSDKETSTGNTFTAGTIDIAVDDQNPWTESWSNYLDKPCETNYMNFVIENVGENPANIWKRLTNVINGPGVAEYPVGAAVCSSEPEYEDGGGLFDANGLPTGDGYTERDNLSAFMIYDMAVCVLNTAMDNCPLIDGSYDTNGNIIDSPHARPDTGGNWVVVIDEADQVRVDNVVDTWIKIADELQPDEKMVVSQSYHLMTWDDSGQPMITNWAQGDTMTFDIELDARQLTAPAPGVDQNNQATALLVQKDTTTWDPIVGGAEGTLTYNVEGPTFVYNFTASGLVNDTYQLIYYPDPWASPKTVVLIGDPIVVAAGAINISDDDELNTDLPDSEDNNYPVGAKVWLVPTSSLSGTSLSWTNLGQFLFDATMVNYNDTEIP